MKVLKVILIITLIISYQSLITAQISINTDGSTPDASAMLDIVSTDKGILIPRMDSTSRNNISSPAIGLMVYDSTTTSFWYYDNNQWNEIRNSTQSLNAYDIIENFQVQYDYSCIDTVCCGLNLSGEPKDLVLSGNYIYSIVETTFKAIDISSPTAPAEVGSLTLGSNPTTLALSGNYAYVIDETDNDLTVIDISNPTAPTKVGSNFAFGSRPVDIAIQGNHAFILTYNNGDLISLDISNPASVSSANSLSAVAPNGTKIATVGNYVYVMHEFISRIYIIDASNPSSLVNIGSKTSSNLGAIITDITIAGNYAYIITNDNNELGILDISAPTAPVDVGVVRNIGNQLKHIQVSGGFAFISDESYENLYVIDVNTPASPSVSYRFSLGSTATSLIISGDYIYVGLANNTLKIIKLTPCDMNIGINPATGEFTIESSNLGNHVANQNIELNNNYLSNDGDDEGISIANDGKVTFSNNIILNGNSISNDGYSGGISIDDNGKVSFSNNILLNNFYLSNDGNNNGISIDNDGNVTTSDQLSIGGNILLNSNYLSNDGGNEGISIDVDGNVTASNDMTINGDLTIADTIRSNGTLYVDDVLLVKNDFIVDHPKTGTDNYVATFQNLANDNSVRNDGVNIVAGHNNFVSGLNSYLINFSTPDNTTIGRIQQNSTGVAYKTTSDIRLKTNIQPTQYGLSDILNIQVSDYFYKKDPAQTPQTGFIAQQLYEIYPTAVTIGGDDEKTNPWMVDYANLTPLIVKSIQNQQSIIQNLTTKNEQWNVEYQKLKSENKAQQAEIAALKAQLQKVKELEEKAAELNALKQQNAEMKAILEQIQTQLGNQ